MMGKKTSRESSPSATPESVCSSNAVSLANPSRTAVHLPLRFSSSQRSSFQARVRSLGDKKSSKSFKSFTLAEGGDIVWQILLRLPMKQLFCCKSVCKAWNLIISNPSFCSEYTRGQPEEGGFLCRGRVPRLDWGDTKKIAMFYIPANYDKTTKKEFLSAIDTRTNPRCPTVVYALASSGGLLLCESDMFPGPSNSPYYICCPLTKKWRKIVSPPNCNQYAIHGFICHEVDDNTTETTSSSKHHHYEIVRILNGTKYLRMLSKRDSIEIQTYSSKTCQWWMDRLPVPSGLESSQSGHVAVFTQGVFYWIVNRGLDFMSYDPTTKELQVFPLPPYVSCMITVSLDTLRNGALCCCRWEPNGPGLEVWVLDRSASSWQSICRVNLHDLCKGSYLDLFFEHVLVSDLFDTLVISFRNNKDRSEALMYGLRSKTVEKRYVGGPYSNQTLQYCNYQKPKWPRQL